MNVYEAYLEVKKGNIIRAYVFQYIYFVMETCEAPIGRKRTIRIELDDAIKFNLSENQIDPDIIKELDEVCISCFEEDAEFLVVSFDQMLKEIDESRKAGKARW